LDGFVQVHKGKETVAKSNGRPDKKAKIKVNDQLLFSDE
jgi:hypothetical protein